MAASRTVEKVSEIVIDPKPGGSRAVFLVETRNSEETREVMNFFSDISDYLQVLPMSKGSLLSFAVQVQEGDQKMLDEIRAKLASRYGFVALHRSFDALIYNILTELCNDTGSKLLPVPKCDICGKVDPFPETIVNLAGEDGTPVASRKYCSTCTAQHSATNNKDFVISLLSADRKDFSRLAQRKLIRTPTRKQRIKFKIEPQAA